MGKEQMQTQGPPSNSNPPPRALVSPTPSPSPPPNPSRSISAKPFGPYALISCAATRYRDCLPEQRVGPHEQLVINGRPLVGYTAGVHQIRAYAAIAMESDQVLVEAITLGMR